MEANQGKFNITETIRRVKSAREELKRARETEREVSKPVLKDYRHIRKIHELFCKSAGVGESMTVVERKMFVFIIQFLYEPRNFFGFVMPRGLRIELAKVLRIKGVTILSRCASCTLSEYRIYTQFRTEVNRIFEDVVNGLVECGVIDPENMDKEK